jgi:serine O-acetyltransferase
MMLAYLKKDLERLYFYQGRPGRKVTAATVWHRALSPRFLPVVLYRMSHAFYKKKLTILARIASLINFHFFGIEIAMRSEIGPGLCFPHTFGIVLGAHNIGCNALIYHEVTVGAKEMDFGFNLETRPVIGDNVVIGAGAKVLGRIRIGNNSVICANSVVLRSFPDNVIVGGVPAQIIRRLGDKPSE